MAARKSPKRARTNAPRLQQPPANERPRPRRPTRAEKDERVSQVMTMLLSGARRIEICQFASKTWAMTARQADRYIADATSLIKAAASKTREDEIIEHIGRMDLIFRAAHGAGDYSNAIKAAQDKAKLRGLYPDPRLRVTGWQDEIIALLRDGKVTVDDVVGELGDTPETRQLIIAAGIRANESRPPESQGAGTV